MTRVGSFVAFALLSSALVAATPGCDGDTVTVAPAATSGSAFRAGETWTGYIESYKFVSGSDQITITFKTPTEGTVFFGAPPTGNEVVNPDVGFPAELEGRMGTGVVAPATIRYFESFPFTIRDGLRENGRMRFWIALGEFWQRWCAAQTTIYTVPNQVTGTSDFSCAPIPLSTSSGQCLAYDEQGTPTGGYFDCAKMTLCSGDHVCTCDANHCELTPTWLERPERNTTNGAGLLFDIHISGEDADGTTGLGRSFLHRQ